MRCMRLYALYALYALYSLYALYAHIDQYSFACRGSSTEGLPDINHCISHFVFFAQYHKLFR